ncbi:MAG TPA: hypothetical protein VLK37_07595 [Solirubrobacterales bacterium]|nr:hypothetical protein [Solirubrobacterales bacterium]
MSAHIATRSFRRLASKALIAVGACGAAVALIAPAAQAEFGLEQFGTSVDRNGAFSRQAGAHADLTTKLRFSGDEQIRDVTAELPPGMVANATVTDKCTITELIGAGDNASLCPPTSQVGIAGVYNTPGAAPEMIKIYNMVPPPNLPALLGFNYEGVLGRIEPHLRPPGYEIVSTVRDIAQTHKISGTDLTLWAVPAAASHERMGRGLFPPTFGELPIPDPAPKLPFLTNPTSCPASPTPFTASVDSWQSTGLFHTLSPTADEGDNPYLWDGCERVPFKPTVTVDPASHLAAAPTGLDVDVKLPQSEDPDGLATAHVRKTVVTLPKGFAISSSAAAGQGACSEAQIGLGTNDPTSCPPSATIGTLKLKTPLLDEELEGEAILARQMENPFGSLLAMYLVVRGPGILIKLPGKIEADPNTGQLTTTFDNLPQQPFEELSLSLRGGPKAPLVTPSACGTYNAQVSMTSWASPVPVDLSAPMAITEGCSTGAFNPVLHAGTTSPVAGAYSPFTLQLLRRDGEQNIAAIQATLPEGVLAKLAGVPLCPDPAAASGDCPADSQVGTAIVGAGAGSNPIYVPEVGKTPTAAYLAGPYKGAPYSLVVKVPAQAGPFDLGTVTVRNALNVDPTTAQVTAVSDPLPQILQGIPIAYRDVRVEIDRPEFTINPTSCEPMKVTSTLTSNLGQTASPSARFQAAGCGELGFKPSLAISLKGKMNRTGNPALTAVLKAPAGQANIAKTTVILPGSEFIDNAHINNPCTRVQFNAKACPPSSILGTATATSPLLDKPVSGPVYFRSNGGERELPDLVADLNGPIHITVVGFIDSVKGRVRTRFANVPDAPVSKFVLKMKGGNRGLLANSRDLCSFTPKAKIQMTGQNGKRHDSDVVLKRPCKP